MPPKKSTAAAKPAAKSKATTKAAPASAKPESIVPPPKKRKASDEETVPVPASKKARANTAPKAPTKAKPAATVPVKKAAAPKKDTKASSAKKETADGVETGPADKLDKKDAPVTKKTAAPKNDVTPKKAAATKKTTSPRVQKVLPDINFAPTQVLQIYVFGEGSAGELGLGAKSADGKKVLDVSRPRLNPRLEPLGVVQIAAGGMHCAALTSDNRIFTWGVNDRHALGRTTTDEGKMKDANTDEDSDSDSDSDDDSGLNPSEAEPRQVDPKHFPEGTRFSSLCASDSATFAVTTTGLVYGWGTFRSNDGVLGFSKDVREQEFPGLIPELKNITALAAGTNHVLALNHRGKVFAWGAGEQAQLARRVVARTATGALVPREFGLQRKSIVTIGCGDYHSFAIDKSGDVYAWGLNTFGQTGVAKDSEMDDTVNAPTLVASLKENDLKQICGGAHHSLACTKKGEVLVWGRVDGAQAGMELDKIPRDLLYLDEKDRPRYLVRPLTVPGINAEYVASGPDTCFAISTAGQAYTWGFSTNYQTGTGTIEDVIEATLVDNTAVRGKKLVFAATGGQYGVLGGLPDAKLTNGI